MAIHLLAAKQIEAANSGQLNDGEGLCLRIDDGQGRWWFRYTAAFGVNCLDTKSSAYNLSSITYSPSNGGGTTNCTGS